jgi:hypothetical protein
MSTKVVPTFLLKSVNPEKLLRDYYNGAFSRLPEKKNKISMHSNVDILAPLYGDDNSSAIFCLKDKNNCDVIRTTTGFNDYEIFINSGGKLPVGGICEHCKEYFDTTIVGYPLNYEEKIILMPETQKYKIIYVFWVEGRFCSFECALGYVRIMLSKPADYKDTTIRDSESLLKLLYKLMYPDASILRPAQEPRLLKINGGSLTREQWQNNKHVYMRTDKIITMPAKVEYLQQSFLNS